MVALCLLILLLGETAGIMNLQAEAIGSIRGYQQTIGALLQRTKLVSCRFQPNCSNYALLAIKRS
jgi:putative component of membrane protein insertase Oxa1/YidC/SpoIIIJ protein YidD